MLGMQVCTLLLKGALVTESLVLSRPARMHLNVMDMPRPAASWEQFMTLPGAYPRSLNICSI